jgi:hypothetical protein
MMSRSFFTMTVLLLAAGAGAQGRGLTLYNEQFAIVREPVRLELEAGRTSLRYDGITAHAEPESVILRDPAGQHAFRIVEQSYRDDALSQGALLSRFEGQTIDFLRTNRDVTDIVSGRIVRSGYVPHRSAYRRYSQEYSVSNISRAYDESSQPIVEVNGKLQFGLPGQPLFPEIDATAPLHPALEWVIASEASAAFDAELSYITGGMDWNADYNLLLPEDSDVLELIGWVTMDNQSGKDFEDVRVQLMAGDVQKIREEMQGGFGGGSFGARPEEPLVSEQSFDEYHLYTLEEPTTLRDRETKQVEFIRAPGIKSHLRYMYRGYEPDLDPNRYFHDRLQNSSYGTNATNDVRIMREFQNSTENNLGIPLPKGLLRFYRAEEANLQFIGESRIDHTPHNETVRVYTGNAFDLTGARMQKEFRSEELSEPAGNFVRLIKHYYETFEITLRNQKDVPVEIEVVEPLYRSVNWKIEESSQPYEKRDSQTIFFTAEVPAQGSTTITYTVHYW